MATVRHPAVVVSESALGDVVCAFAIERALCIERAHWETVCVGAEGKELCE